ncbi:MAG: hypothetical protein ABJN35_00065 [Erythrobacter sp.]
MIIDTTFDVYSDTPKGKDPDSYSPTLRRFHQALWSKELPNGKLFGLTTNEPKTYLHHKSVLGNFALSSDSFVHSYRYLKKTQQLVEQVPEAELDQFYAICSTIGGYIIFPSRRIDGKLTINGARGFYSSIMDRADLTLECIRRHYEGGESPLGGVLARYADFFALFEDFCGYTDFFLLQDLVRTDGSGVSFLLPFDDFNFSPLPASLSEYATYRSKLAEFVLARNERIESQCTSPS